MYKTLWLVPALPMLGFLILVFARLTKNQVAMVGVGSVALSTMVAAAIGWSFIASPPVGSTYVQPLWSWVDTGAFQAVMGLRLDSLSLLMILVVTFVGFLIHLYSTEYMAGDPGYARFFAYMNLFMASMLTLVLADNLVFLYIGWEGVGLCSFLLIGFWYSERKNARAAMKAFLITRIGDTAFAVGLFLLYFHFGTLNIQSILDAAPAILPAGSMLAWIAPALLLGGAVGKSAQTPLQTWLPDAMAGPTPVSALIHAATMVTAGVYLIARTHTLFTGAPWVQFAVAVIGAVTLLIAATSALTQRDLKRALAYSTISQIGYMFLALGVGAWSAAMFHFATHAFFKALLFLAAGAIINAAHHEQDMFKMGGLYKKIPFIFWVFFIGAACLAAIPFVTSGFYSKDAILQMVWSSSKGGLILWLCGVVGAFITAVYSFRMVLLVFFGKPQTQTAYRPGPAVKIALGVLAFFSLGFGYIQLPEIIANVQFFSHFLERTLPAFWGSVPNHAVEWALLIFVSLVTIAGVGVAARVYYQEPALPARLLENRYAAAIHNFWEEGWGFDAFYTRFIVNPFLWLVRINSGDVVNVLYWLIEFLSERINILLSHTQTGKTRTYAAVMVGGAVITIGLLVLL